MRRWLRSFVGRPWTDVHSLVLRTFDTRTLAGRHVVFDHLLAEVDAGVRPCADEVDHAMQAVLLRLAVPR